ncbi:hypothetical protein BV25DRAFT_1475465 [Artomyces pyxidatus]|uniref:Uncharacterized protein n=1 Tax=Artomyces pyxidatus TaxID=48021 RepID=A0ACB8SKZ0_9AGAM|nr:hypothetical protein BV25DRAFT_1475465 [Artomyces pyxidatus]
MVSIRWTRNFTVKAKRSRTAQLMRTMGSSFAVPHPYRIDNDRSVPQRTHCTSTTFTLWLIPIAVNNAVKGRLYNSAFSQSIHCPSPPALALSDPETVYVSCCPSVVPNRLLSLLAIITLRWIGFPHWMGFYLTRRTSIPARRRSSHLPQYPSIGITTQASTTRSAWSSNGHRPCHSSPCRIGESSHSRSIHLGCLDMYY